MEIVVFTLEFREEKGGFDTEALDNFLKGKEVLSVKDHFFQYRHRPYLALVVSLSSPPSKDTVPQGRKELDLNEEEEKLFEILRQWRNERASKEGYAPYIVFTNRQIAEIARMRPRTLSALEAVYGVGKSKIDQYGRDLLKIVKKGTGLSPSPKEGEVLEKKNEQESP